MYVCDIKKSNISSLYIIY